jgi:transcriptional regulator GlxA family with amidase domain
MRQVAATKQPGRRGSVRSQRVIFALYDGCEMIDFAGPMQAFHEANAFGGNYVLGSFAEKSSILTSLGLRVSGLRPLPSAQRGDLVVVPGYPIKSVKVPLAVAAWVKESYQRGAQVCSTCTGAFILAEAGLLAGRHCTTHWRRTEELQRRFPSARVMEERLFVEDGRVMTSAGSTSGTDMTLAIIERHHGPLVAAKVARALVVYIRRDAQHHQRSVYLDYRTHLNPGVHAVQDLLTADPAGRAHLRELAELAHMSARNLTRAFREATGIGIHAYRTRLRLEHARTLLNDPELTLETIAARCGFNDGRQFRRVWREAFGSSPSRMRRKRETALSPPARGGASL